MSLKSLKLANFRSYEEVEFEFDPEMTAIVGPNGSGKTNVLEAIYTLSMTKGFRDNPADMVRGDEEWFRIEADVDGDKLAISWKDGAKKITRNDKEMTPHDYLGSFPVVLFEPSSLMMVKGAPALRRQWLDRVLSFSDKKYLVSLLQYRKSLKQRNALLRQPGIRSEEIFAWDMILSEHAEYIAKKRSKTLESMRRNFSKHYKKISGSDENVVIEYTMNIDNDDYRNQLLDQLQTRLERDKRMGGTSVGPHRDDIGLLYNDKPLSQYGSRGENRTAVLALVLCELEYLSKKCKLPPVLLLDDVLSELDESRQKSLISAIKGIQTILTTTEIDTDIGKHKRIDLGGI